MVQPAAEKSARSGRYRRSCGIPHGLRFDCRVVGRGLSGPRSNECGIPRTKVSLHILWLRLDSTVAGVGNASAFCGAGPHGVGDRSRILLPSGDIRIRSRADLRVSAGPDELSEPLLPAGPDQLADGDPSAPSRLLSRCDFRTHEHAFDDSEVDVVAHSFPHWIALLFRRRRQIRSRLVCWCSLSADTPGKRLVAIDRPFVSPGTDRSTTDLGGAAFRSFDCATVALEAHSISGLSDLRRVPSDEFAAV